MTDIEKGKKLINNYVQSEFGYDADFSDLEKIGVAYSTITDEELEVQISIDLIHMQMIYDVFSFEKKIRKDITLEDLENLDFCYLISESEEYYFENNVCLRKE